MKGGRLTPDWIAQEQKREYHDVSSLFPLMDGAEFEDLKNDIAENGLREPIWLHPNQSIIDGRNRHRACLRTQTRPEFRVWDENGSLLSFVLSMNLYRRHLTSSQRAAFSLDALPIAKVEAEKRMLAGTSPDPSQKVDQGKAAEQVARLFDTNRQYVSDAKSLQEKAPDLLNEVKQGNLTIPQAKRELVRRNRVEAPPLPSEKYRIIYADPPWRYGNAGVIGETDNYGHVHRHYPSMSIVDLQLMGEQLGEITEPDAVLFLWTTSPQLEAAFKVIKAWGFKYKTSFVWDKVGHNFGHYNSVRHEFLLVCTRGSCTPDNGRLYDSVISIPKSKTHSEKPEEFREMIDDLYTHGKRIELFARKSVDGWDAWGNEGIS